MNKPRRERLPSGSLGLLFWTGLRQITKAAGYSFRPIWLTRKPSKIAVWGRVDRSLRQIQKYKSDTQIITFEDAFLRSVKPGPGTPPLGITIDRTGVHFDATKPSDIETHLQTAPLDDPHSIVKARDGIDFLRHYGLSKYNLCPRGSGPDLTPGYVLVVDQVAGDASIRFGNANGDTFAEMLATARADHPDKRIIIRSHPATDEGRSGFFTDQDIDSRTEILDCMYNPWDMIENATAVYCVTSMIGFEAILANKRPVVFGTPFYAGWGLTEDRQTISRRTRKLTVEQLFCGAMFDYAIWFDRTTSTLCTFETAARQLLAESRHFWNGRLPMVAVGMRLWKRPHIAKFLGGGGQRPLFYDSIPSDITNGTRIIGWANKIPVNAQNVIRMEDGFLRSSGLGADLTPPGSLVVDEIGIYYDPRHPSRLESLIATSNNLPNFAIKRAAALREQVIQSGVTKYNLSGSSAMPHLPADKKIILVPGQVEDDASILLGTSEINTNAKLVEAVRRSNPNAYIIYKPHPDAEARLREGGQIDSKNYDYLAERTDPKTLIASCDEVWTMTSLLGFEALLRDKKVVCLGMPFYAGWGLTDDQGQTCPRRNLDITLDGLIHAALIDYPSYLDPVSGLPCTAETAVVRLSNGQGYRRPLLRILAKLQGWFSQFAFIWR